MDKYCTFIALLPHPIYLSGLALQIQEMRFSDKKEYAIVHTLSTQKEFVHYH